MSFSPVQNLCRILCFVSLGALALGIDSSTWGYQENPQSQELLLPLLSDLAYYQLKVDTQNALSNKRIHLKDHELNFHTVQIKYLNQSFEPHYQKQSSHLLSLLLPPYLNYRMEVLGLYHSAQKTSVVWHRTLQIKPPESLAKISSLIPFRSFRGHLIFADAYPRISADFRESYSQENAIFLRGIDHELRTVFLDFNLSKQEDKEKKWLPPRAPQTIYFHPPYLYISRDKGWSGQRHHLVNTKNHKNFPIASTAKPSSIHPCFYSLTQGHHYTIKFLPSPNSPTQLLLTLSSNSCDPSLFYKHLQLKPKAQITPESQLITLPKKLSLALEKKTIYQYHLTQNHHLKNEKSFYALFVKTSEPHRFTQKNISDDYVILLNQDFSVDGAFSITPFYYSPRDNISFFPTLQKHLQSLRL